MGEGSQPLTTEDGLRQSNRDLLKIMFGLIAVMSLAAGIIAGVRAGVGIIAGGMLAWPNFRWLDSSTRAIMVDPLTATTTILAMKFVLRYVLIAAVLLIVWYYELLPVVAVIAGLASFSLAVVFRGSKSIFTGSI